MRKWKALYWTKALNRSSRHFTTLKLYSMKVDGQALLCSKVVKHESGRSLVMGASGVIGNEKITG